MLVRPAAVALVAFALATNGARSVSIVSKQKFAIESTITKTEKAAIHLHKMHHAWTPCHLNIASPGQGARVSVLHELPNAALECVGGQFTLRRLFVAFRLPEGVHLRK